MLQVENRAGKPGNSQSRPSRPSKDNFGDVWVAIEALLKRVDAKSFAHETTLDNALEERDQRIVELQGLVSNQAVVIDQLVAARASVQSQLEGIAAKFGDLEGMIEARADALGELVTSEIRVFRQEVQVTVERIVDNGETALLELQQAHEGEVAARVALGQTTETVFAAVEARENTLELVLKATGDAADQAHAGLDLQIKSLQDRLAEMRDQTTVRAEDLDQRLVGAVTRLEDVSENVVSIRACMEGFAAGAAEQGLEIEVVRGRLDQAEGIVQALAHATGESAAATEQVHQRLATEISDVRTATEDLVAGVVHQFRELQVASRTWISKLPKNLLVDSKGDLIAVTGEGDLQTVGHVQGARGLDGATVQDITMVDDQLQVTMTDGRNLRVKVPLAPAGELGEADPDPVQVKAAQLHADGKSFTQIGKDLGVDRRTVSKWLRGNKIK